MPNLSNLYTNNYFRFTGLLTEIFSLVWIVLSGLCYSSWIEDNTLYSARWCSLQSIKLIHSRGTCTLLIVSLFLNTMFLCIVTQYGADIWIFYTQHSDAVVVWLHSILGDRSRGGAWLGRDPPLFWVKKEKSQKKRKACRASKSTPPLFF